MGRVISTIDAPDTRFLAAEHVADRYWRDHIACASTVLVPGQTVRAIDQDAAEAFFPTGPLATHAFAAAKEICAGCPVRDICLADALLRRHPDEIGVRGGMSAAEREALTAQERDALIAPFLPTFADDEE
ncbi:WhiB family transcriptional regulator [Amycolatopsis sp. NPDC023774]|uniref:WhiB family transcriptional regulator n=1 Tax=Amycolatopsis sp. NPDC023774 TaxID=3155015 RepID=UPI0033E8A3C3